MIVYLHGGFLRGDAVNRLREAGLTFRLETKRDFPFVVLSPLLPVGEYWMMHEEAVVGLIDHISEEYKVDRNRIYLTGHSLGGQGTGNVMADQNEAMKLVERLEGTLIADLNSLVEWAGDFDRRQGKGPGLGGLNFTLSLLALVGCETLGFFTTGAAQHRQRASRARPDLGTYIMAFIRDYFPRESPFRKLEKVLADFLRHDLVHGFGCANPSVPFELSLFISKATSKRVTPGYLDGKKLLKMNSIALARDTMAAFYTLKHKVRSGTDKPLLARMVQAKNLALPVSRGALKQFDVVHRDLERQAKRRRTTKMQGGI